MYTTQYVCTHIQLCNIVASTFFTYTAFYESFIGLELWFCSCGWRAFWRIQRLIRWAHNFCGISSTNWDLHCLLALGHDVHIEVVTLINLVLQLIIQYLAKNSRQRNKPSTPPPKKKINKIDKKDFEDPNNSWYGIPTDLFRKSYVITSIVAGGCDSEFFPPCFGGTDRWHWFHQAEFERPLSHTALNSSMIQKAAECVGFFKMTVVFLCYLKRCVPTCLM